MRCAIAKRFTDNEKWKKRFFKSLSTVNKLFFLYILDECDNAGIWHVELEIAEPRIGEKLNLESAKKELGKHIFEFDDGEKWFIPFFIDFQYGSLNPSVNAHKSVIDKLEKRGLTKIYEQFINSSRTDLDKDKDKIKDKVMVKDKVKSEIGDSYFDYFWDSYDKKVGKPNTKKEWNKLTEAEKQKVFEILPAYINSKTDKQFRKDPERFLKHKVFNDEIIEVKYGNNTKQSGASPEQLAAIVARRFKREQAGD